MKSTGAATGRPMMAARTTTSRQRYGASSQADQMNSLTDAKDRAQVSATSAMSIINVGMLREVIRLGPRFSMFTPLVILISVSIFLQVMAGLLGIMVSNMKSNFQKFGTVIYRCKCWRVLKKWCCCCVEFSDETEPAVVTSGSGKKMAPFEEVVEEGRRERAQREQPGEDQGKSREEQNTNVDETVDGTDPEEIRSTTDGNAIAGIESETGKSKERFKSQTGGRSKPLSRLLSKTTSDMLQREESLAEVRVMANFLDNQIDELKAELKKLKKEQTGLTEAGTGIALQKQVAASELEQMKDNQQQEPLASTSENNQGLENAAVKLHQVDDNLRQHSEQTRDVDTAIRQRETRLKAIMEERDELTKRQVQFEVEEEKQKIYNEIYTDSQQMFILKRVTYWQQIINYILYTVFVVNSFITAFSFLSHDPA